jgi:hypothetical protein
VEACAQILRAMSKPLVTPSRRLVFLDALRLLAIFQMLQGHTLDAVLDPALRSGPVYALWSALRGLTSVAFLFVAGFSTALILFGDYARQRSERNLVRARVRRALGLVALGYLLHLPIGALLAGRPAEALQTGAVVDILQCIGVTLLLLELALRLCPTPQALCALAALGVVGSLGLATFAWQLAERLPTGLAGYLGPVEGTLFPLWPWSAHLWLGVLAGGLLRPRLPGVSRTGLRLGLAAGGLGSVGWLTGQLAGSDAIAALHLGRAAWVLAVAAGLSFATAALPRLPAALQQVSSCSLRIYVAHVLVVYADGVGLSSRPGPSLSLPWALALTALVVAGSAGLAWLPAPSQWVVARVPRTG